MISIEDYAWFVDRTLDQMVAILIELGDERSCERPDLPGANSAYGIVTHCVGVMTYWAGHLVAGREVVRDRDTEFVAVGSVADLVAKVDSARRQFRDDIALSRFDDPLHFAVSPADAELPFGLRQGSALFHVFEELSQHLGQMEISRDLLIART